MFFFAILMRPFAFGSTMPESLATHFGHCCRAAHTFRTGPHQGIWARHRSKRQETIAWIGRQATDKVQTPTRRTILSALQVRREADSGQASAERPGSDLLIDPQRTVEEPSSSVANELNAGPGGDDIVAASESNRPSPEQTTAEEGPSGPTGTGAFEATDEEAPLNDDGTGR